MGARMADNALRKKLKKLAWAVLLGALVVYVALNWGTISKSSYWATISKYLDAATRPPPDSLRSAEYSTEGYVQSVSGNEFTVEFAYNRELTCRCVITDSVLIDVREDAIGRDNTESSEVMKPGNAIKMIAPGQAIYVAGVQGGENYMSRVTYIEIILNGGFDKRLEGAEYDALRNRWDRSNNKYPVIEYQK